MAVLIEINPRHAGAGPGRAAKEQRLALEVIHHLAAVRVSQRPAHISEQRCNLWRLGWRCGWNCSSLVDFVKMIGVRALDDAAPSAAPDDFDGEIISGRTRGERAHRVISTEVTSAAMNLLRL